MAVDMTKASYKLWIFRGMLAVITLTAFLSIPSYYFPQTALGKGWSLKFASIGVFIPEGWAFFTRDPREESRLIFVEEEGAWRQLAAYRLSPETHFGFNRHMRAQNVRFSQVLSSLPSLDTINCLPGEDAKYCLKRIDKIQTAEAPSALPQVCGAIVGYVYVKPIPWEWKRRNSKLESKMRAGKVKISCA